MGFDLQGLSAAVAEHGRVARIVIAAIRGSSPREVGAAMLVWETGQSGTIGGGTLEYQAARTARSAPRAGLSQHALGPGLGQCCGGAVTLLTEFYDAKAVNALDPEIIARPVADRSEMTIAVRRALARARSQGVAPAPQLIDGWMIEPVHVPARSLWIWGAGHVGRALVQVLAPMPDLAITWVDTAPNRFPDEIAEGVTVIPATQPAELVHHAPAHAEHLILTYSHTIDLELCHRLLSHQFAFAGLIGSRTKWARFRSRLASLGHRAARIDDITCPIGDPSLGKHPQMIAVGVAASLMQTARATQTKEDLSA